VCGRQFSIAAACKREKQLWMAAVRQALATPPAWGREPASSLCQRASKGDAPCAPDEPAPDDKDKDRARPLPPPSAYRDREDASPPAAPAPARRLSTASVKTVFSAAEDILIRRASAAHRREVNRALADVLSPAVAAARFQAEARDEELFAAPRRPPAGVSRTNSALSVAGMGIAAKDRLRGRDSVLIMRRGSYVAADGASPPLTPPEAGSAAAAAVNATDAPRAVRSKATKAQMKKALAISPIVVPVELAPPSGAPLLTQSPEGSAGTESEDAVPPPPPSPPSALVLAPAPASTDPADAPLVVLAPDAAFRPKRTRSMVDNVREFFGSSRPSSPSTSTSSVDRAGALVPSPDEPRRSPSRFRWLVRGGSLRRRVWSNPDEASLPSTPSAEDERRARDPEPLALRTIDEGSLSAAATTFSRRRSLLIPWSQEADPSKSKRVTPPSRRKSIKHVLFSGRSPDTSAQPESSA
jgi:hypothetical protein